MFRPRRATAARAATSPAPSVPALVGAVAAFAFIAPLTACSPGEPDRSETDPALSAEVLFTESPPAWFEAYFVSLDVAPDGGRALFAARRLIDLEQGAEVALDGGLDAVAGGTLDSEGVPVVVGRHDGAIGWFRVGGQGPAAALSSFPEGRRPVWSASGDRIAWVGGPGPGNAEILIGPADGSAEPASYTLAGAPEAVEWASGDSELLHLVTDEEGLSTLYALDTSTGESRRVAADLDGPWRGGQIAVGDDGRAAYLALASDGMPAPAARHDPVADRDLDIYRVDLASGALRPVVRTPAEELAPTFAGGALYWTSIETHSDAVILPAGGGDAHVVAPDVQGPTWRPDGRAVGVTTGAWRLADWALNLDGGVVEIDADGNPAGPVEPIITGYHEDFSPAWSPDGRWIAYHSHRSSGPVSGYAAEGSTDDIFVRHPDEPTSEELRLTDFGLEVGTPDWAPDGRRLLTVSWDRDAPGGGRSATTWVLEMNPDDGTLVGRSRVPAPVEAPGIPTWAAWSPSREEIAVTFAVPFAGDGELWMMAPDGGSARRVLGFTGSQYGGLDWTADGESLVYSALVEGRQQLFSVSRDGGEPRQLTTGAANLFHPRVSPDGRWIAATQIDHTVRIMRASIP